MQEQKTINRLPDEGIEKVKGLGGGGVKRSCSAAQTRNNICVREEILGVMRGEEERRRSERRIRDKKKKEKLRKTETRRHNQLFIYRVWYKLQMERFPPPTPPGFHSMRITTFGKRERSA